MSPLAMSPLARAWITAAPAPIVCEHALDRAFLLQTKTALRRLAAEKGIDLPRERVSLWRARGAQDFEHVASTRSFYQAVSLAESFGEDVFLFDAPGDGFSPVAAGVGK
jgi:hypothetical protein